MCVLVSALRTLHIIEGMVMSSQSCRVVTGAHIEKAPLGAGWQQTTGALR
jgi:hypothetical protein